MFLFFLIYAKNIPLLIFFTPLERDLRGNKSG